jgi:hypothetical protein
MRDWLTIDIVLGALLVTSFTCIGTVSLWAATSRRHWFLRAAALMGVLAMPLLVPAYEPLLMFTTQAGVIVAGVKLRERRQLRELRSHVLTDTVELRIPSTFRFSLATLLLVMVLLSIAAAPLARAAEYFSRITYAAPLSMLVDGAAAGVAVLLAAWIFVSRRKRYGWVIASAIVLLLSAAVPSVDWLHLSVTSDAYGYWPPVPANWPPRSLGVSLAGPLYARAAIFWLSVLASLTIVPVFVIASARRAWLAFPVTRRVPCSRRDSGVSMFAKLKHAYAKEPRKHGTPVRRLTRFVFLSSWLLWSVFPLYVLWQLLHPLPVPKIKAPDPNGIDEVVAAGQSFSNSPLFNFLTRGFNFEPPTDALAKEIELYSKAFSQLREGMSKEIQVVMFPEDGDLEAAQIRSMTEIRPIAFAAYALSSKSELARRLGRYGESAQHAIEAVRLGSRVSRDSDVNTLIFSTIVMEGIAAGKLFRVLPNLSSSECRDTIAALNTFEREREPLADAEFRDRIREENIIGWPGKFLSVLKASTNVRAEYLKHCLLRQQQARAINRLLTLQLAVRAYQLENGSLPNKLEKLVPQYLEQLPFDPFNPHGGPLRYRQTGESFLAYSFGADGDDDHGRPPAVDASGYRDPFGDGDLRLDIFFEPRPTPATNAANNSSDKPPDKPDN